MRQNMLIMSYFAAFISRIVLHIDLIYYILPPFAETNFYLIFLPAANACPQGKPSRI